MAPPIYFLPSLSDKDVVTGGKLVGSVLERFGLSLLLADVGPVAEDIFLSPISTATGPGGHAGVLLCALPTNGEKPERLGYYPQLQTWQEHKHKGQSLWAGLDNEQPIKPTDIVRKEVIPGYTCELPGGVWSIPVIRNPEGGTGLPKDWQWGDDGEVTEIVQASYRNLWEDFAGVVDLYFGDNGDAGALSLTPMEAMRRCSQVLAVNYRFGRIEQNVLGVINSKTWATILTCAVDLPTFWDVFEAMQQGKQKKSEDKDGLAPKGELPNTSLGPPGGSPDTGPAEAS